MAWAVLYTKVCNCNMYGIASTQILMCIDCATTNHRHYLTLKPKMCTLFPKLLVVVVVFIVIYLNCIKLAADNFGGKTVNILLHNVLQLHDISYVDASFPVHGWNKSTEVFILLSYQCTFSLSLLHALLPWYCHCNFKHSIRLASIRRQKQQMNCHKTCVSIKNRNWNVSTQHTCTWCRTQIERESGQIDKWTGPDRARPSRGRDGERLF